MTSEEKLKKAEELLVEVLEEIENDKYTGIRDKGYVYVDLIDDLVQALKDYL